MPEILATLPVLSDGLVLLEDFKEVKGAVFAEVFNAEVIDNEYGQYRSLLVNPDARCGGSLVVSSSVRYLSSRLLLSLPYWGIP